MDSPVGSPGLSEKSLSGAGKECNEKGIVPDDPFCDSVTSERPDASPFVTDVTFVLHFSTARRRIVLTVGQPPATKFHPTSHGLLLFFVLDSFVCWVFPRFRQFGLVLQPSPS